MYQISVELPEKSTGILPDARNLNAGHPTGMNLPKVLQRIEHQLKVLEMSADKASKKAGKPDAIRNIRRAVKVGGRGVNVNTIEALAPVLQKSPAWLLGEEESNTRLRQARKAAGFETASAAAREYDWVLSTYISHENGQTPVPKAAAEEYAKKFKVDTAWLLNIEGSINQPPKKHDRGGNLPANLIGATPDIELDDLASVPEMDIYGGSSRGGGFNQEENTTDRLGNTFSSDVIRTTWGIPTPFLRSELNTSPGRANIIPVRGDSMNDALFAGDRAIINLDDTDVGQDGIFALLDDSASLIIKQVEVVRGSRARRIICTSRNPSYKPFELELTDPVRIIGRVVGKITRV
jgi:phage repressor protein C with HTH and peptisase S24 domain